jgi:type II secretory pathway component GspD/PulD (secretin)
MRLRTLIAALIICATAICRYCQVAAQGADAPNSKAESAPNERLLFPISHLEPKELAEKLESIFNHGAVQTVKVVPVPDANSLLISAPKTTLSEMVKMLGELDQPPKMVAIDVWIVNVQKPGERIDGKDGFDQSLLLGAKEKVEDQLGKLAKEGRVTVANHFHTTALSNHQSFEQQGTRVARVTATNVIPAGRVSTTQFENIGSIVRVTPRVAENDPIKLVLEVEKSYIGSDEKGVVISKLNGEEVRSPSYFTMVFKNEVAVPHGRVVKLDGIERPSTDEEGNFVILVAAEIVPVGAGK